MEKLQVTGLMIQAKCCESILYGSIHVGQPYLTWKIGSFAGLIHTMIPSTVTVEQLQQMNKSTLAEHLGIQYTAIGPDFIEATMPVDDRTRQPYGILHGGASVALAETIGSVGSHLCIDTTKYHSVGLEINANHIRMVKDGFVTGRAKLVHCGRTTHLWDIRLTDKRGKLVCMARLTVAIVRSV